MGGTRAEKDSLPLPSYYRESISKTTNQKTTKDTHNTSIVRVGLDWRSQQTHVVYYSTNTNTIMSIRVPFPGNGKGFYAEYDKKEDHFVVLYKNSARFYKDPIDVRRSLGVAKFTPSGDAVKEWAVEVSTPVRQKRAEKEARADTSFASEAQAEDSDDPTANTRMII